MQAKYAREDATEIRTLRLPSGRPMPVLGQGTWNMGEDPAKRHAEIEALQLGLDLGMTLIDTAEMYGEGASEKLIGEAIEGRPRSEIFLVSKVLPHNATAQGTVEACVRSLKRLRTPYLNLYLLHWRGGVPLDETLEAFHLLKKKGAILDYGVSNFDVDDMREWYMLPHGDETATDQVLYNLLHRGIEWDLMHWCHVRQIPIMAYSPIEHSPRGQQKMLDHPTLKGIAERHDATPAQIVLAWLLDRNVVVIPKAASLEHVRENRAAHDIKLTELDLAEIDETFPPPERKIPLEMI
jgi:diketogulonate reductase-like aldo/keto reductase